MSRATTALAMISSTALLAGCSVTFALPSRSTDPVPSTAGPAPTSATPSAGPDLEAAFQRVGPSVVQVMSTYCDAPPSTGSGFIVGDDVVMTAAHVVEGARSVTIRLAGADPIEASVVGLDLHTDSAVLRMAAPLMADALSFADAGPSQGASVGVLGYPLGDPGMHINQGIVSATQDDIVMADSSTLRDVLTVDAAINPGNSGGPVIDAFGKVVGLVHGGRTRTTVSGGSLEFAEGMKYVIPARYLVGGLAEWSGDQPRAEVRCEAELNGEEVDGVVPDVLVSSDHADAEALAFVLFAHGLGINDAEYESSWAMFTPEMQRRMNGLDRWSAGLKTSFWYRIEVTAVRRTGDHAVATTSLMTRQAAEDGPNGLTCSVWSIDYAFVLTSGAWLINQASGLADPRSC